VSTPQVVETLVAIWLAFAVLLYVCAELLWPGIFKVILENTRDARRARRRRQELLHIDRGYKSRRIR
jgi:F0F1-type ATP synthase membrane subunit b/b'